MLNPAPSARGGDVFLCSGWMGVEEGRRYDDRSDWTFVSMSPSLFATQRLFSSAIHRSLRPTRRGVDFVFTVDLSRVSRQEPPYVTLSHLSR